MEFKINVGIITDVLKAIFKMCLINTDQSFVLYTPLKLKVN